MIENLGRTQTNKINKPMFIDFVRLCPIRVVIMLNFNVSKEVC